MSDMGTWMGIGKFSQRLLNSSTSSDAAGGGCVSEAFSGVVLLSQQSAGRAAAGTRFVQRVICEVDIFRRRGTGLLILASVIMCAAILPGCGSWKLSRKAESDVVAMSTRADAQGAITRLAPSFSTVVFATSDSNTAQIFMTDLPASRLLDFDDKLHDASGVIVHVAIFLTPTAGRTPIDNSACNAAVRQVILTGGNARVNEASQTKVSSSTDARASTTMTGGTYGGGGFVTASGLNRDFATITIREATVRLTRRTADFHDALGPAVLSGDVRAKFDPELAGALQQRMLEISGQIAEVKAQ
jgi:hypothetical protein